MTYADSLDNFIRQLRHYGVAMGPNDGACLDAISAELMFVEATIQIHKSSRVAEAFMTWLSVNYKTLNPLLIKNEVQSSSYDKAIFGAFVDFVISRNPENKNSWVDLLGFSEPAIVARNLFSGPRARTPNPHFLKFNVIAPMLVANPSHYLYKTA